MVFFFFDQAALNGRQVGSGVEGRGDFAAACSESTVKIFDIFTLEEYIQAAKREDRAPPLYEVRLALRILQP